MSLLKIEITDGPNQAIFVTDQLGEVQDVVDTFLTTSSPSTPTEDLGSLLEAIDDFFTVVVEGSSLVESISYNFATQELQVGLTTGEYEYDNVPPSVFLEFVAADSKGQFFNAEIKGQY